MHSQPNRFSRQSLALFFIVSLIPALVVAAIWYVNSQTTTRQILDFQSYVLPVMVLGVLPALILSFIFAELLTRPVRRIHRAVLELANGNFKAQFRGQGAGEFQEIGVALDQVAAKLQQTLSEATSETAIIEAERNKLRGVLGAMTDGVFALDHSGRIILFNKAASQLTGRTMEEVAGQLAEKVMPFRQDGELVMTRWLASERGNRHKIGQWTGLELYRADGQSLYVDVQAVVLNDDPNGIAALVTFHDLTKNRQLEEMKIDFVALAAHELRTPLTEIKGYLDILQHEAKGLSKTNRDFLDRTVASANQLSGLMRNLLNVARIEHGELGYQPMALNYLDFVKETMNELQARAKQQERQLKLVVPGRLPTLMADPMALREVIVNLVDNAITHTAPGTGAITITVSRHRNEIETSVKDNGVGIPSDAIPHLFTKFYRVSEMKSTSRGTGLGLYICKSIIETHGGHIWVDSAIGEGSVFTFRVPLEAVAQDKPNSDNTTTSTITRGAHGWIKDHPIH
ncbi:MAG: multi-sensor signal transduction histidine kinase [Patescibacteria group bacterium]|nr:multi-sensor signal transduction histidine kinase [Patescibacteria group bacterium]